MPASRETRMKTVISSECSVEDGMVVFKLRNYVGQLGPNYTFMTSASLCLR